MIKNKTLALLFCSAALACSIGTVAFSSAAANPKAANAAIESGYARIYFNPGSSWTDISSVKLNNVEMTASDDTTFMAKYGSYGIDVDLGSLDSLSAVDFVFTQSGAKLHPEYNYDGSNKTWNTSSKLQFGLDLQAGHQYKVSDIHFAYEYDNKEHKWFTYSVTDLGLETVSYTLVFEINDFGYDVMDNNIYVKLNSEWGGGQKDGHHEAYFYGDGTEWVDLVATGESDVYYCERPTDKNYTNVIFVRMPNDVHHTFTGAWNQTADLTFNSEKNFYTMNSGWNGPTTNRSIKYSDVQAPAEFSLYSYGMGNYQELGPWRGVNLPKVANEYKFQSTSGKTLYAYEFIAPEQNNIIVSVKNSTLANAPKTESMAIAPSNGKCVYGFKINFANTDNEECTPVAYNEAAEAYLFMKKFAQVTSERVAGNICQATSASVNALCGAYSSLSAEAHALVDNVLDITDTNYTVAATVDFLNERYSNNPGSKSIVKADSNAFALVVVTSMAAILAIGGVVVIRRKRA